MDPARLMTLPCTVTPMSVTSTDDRGDDVLTAGTPVDTTCWIEQTASSEQTAGTHTTDETMRLFLPPATVIDADDRVTVEGLTYELTGPPWLAFNPRSRTHTHLEAQIRRVA